MTKMYCIIFLPVNGMRCSYGKIFSPLTKIPVGKTEISATEPTRLLIWTHLSFYKGFRGEARSRKPGQPRLTGLIWRGPKQCSAQYSALGDHLINSRSINSLNFLTQGYIFTLRLSGIRIQKAWGISNKFSVYSTLKKFVSLNRNTWGKFFIIIKGCVSDTNFSWRTGIFF